MEIEHEAQKAYLLKRGDVIARRMYEDREGDVYICTENRELVALSDGAGQGVRYALGDLQHQTFREIVAKLVVIGVVDV